MKLQKPKQMKKIGINQQQTAGGQRLMRQAAVALAVSLALGAGQVSAGKKGPRASVLSETRCALELGIGKADLVVKTTLTNKSSGDVSAELRGGSIKGTYKKKGERGKAYHPLASPVYIDPVPQSVDPEALFPASFNLCAEEGNVKIARELNGEATMMYGISGGTGETRKVVNRCSDDPSTESVNEGGIKVTPEIFKNIKNACGW